MNVVYPSNVLHHVGGKGYNLYVGEYIQYHQKRERSMSYRSRFVIIILLVYILTTFVTPAQAGVPVVGRSAVLIDSKSGQILYTKNENQRLPPASTTKILTAIIALEQRKLIDEVVSGTNPGLVEPSAIGLKEGEKMVMENLLYSILLKSANDAAVAIAEEISGSVPEFAALMNKKARELGCTGSNFANPNGLPDPNHYSTAHDLAIIARYAMEKPEFRNFVSTKVKTIPRADDSDIKWLQNHNKLLWQYDGANGIKTGYTREAKQCLVASAEKDGREFIAVILGSEGNNIWSDAKGLLDYGFANFSTLRHKTAGTQVKTVEVAKGVSEVDLVTEKDYYYTVAKGKDLNVSESIVVNNNISAPVKKGQVLGRVKFMASNREIGSVNLVAQNDVPVKNYPLKKAASSTNTLLVGALMITVFVVWNVRKRRRKARRRSRLWINRDLIK